MSSAKLSKLTWQRYLKYVVLRLIRMQSTPEAIARGLAVGVFAGWFPIFGFQTVVALLLAIPLQGNKLVAAAGTWISNPFTYIPIYVFNYQVGKWLLGVTAEDPIEMFISGRDQSWIDLGREMITVLFTGCAFVGILSAGISYWMGLWFVRYMRKRRSDQRRAASLRSRSLAICNTDPTFCNQNFHLPE